MQNENVNKKTAANANLKTKAEVRAMCEVKAKTDAKAFKTSARSINSLLYIVLSEKFYPGQIAIAKQELHEIFGRKDAVTKKRAEWSFSEGIAYMMSQSASDAIDHSALRKLDAGALRLVKSEGFTIATFVKVCHYLLLRYTSAYTTERDRLNVKSTMILNLFMLQSCYLDKNVIFWKVYIKPSAMKFDAGELAVFDPNHNLLVILNMLRHYYKLNIFGKKAADIFKLIIEAIEPTFGDFAPENQLYIGSVIEELKQCRTWPKEHIASDMMLSQIQHDKLLDFDGKLNEKGGQLYVSDGKRYMITMEKFFLPLI